MANNLNDMVAPKTTKVEYVTEAFEGGVYSSEVKVFNIRHKRIVPRVQHELGVLISEFRDEVLAVGKKVEKDREAQIENEDYVASKLKLPKTLICRQLEFLVLDFDILDGNKPMVIRYDKIAELPRDFLELVLQTIMETTVPKDASSVTSLTGTQLEGGEDKGQKG